MDKRSIRLLCALALLPVAASAQSTGPSTSTPAYVIPDANLPPGAVSTTSLITTGDMVGSYRFVGIPDGIGAFDAYGAVTVVTTHELGAGQGIVRAHGSTGSLVSRLTIDPQTFAVLSGRDHSTSPTDVFPYDRTLDQWVSGTFAWDRFCSADLPEPGAFLFGGLGTQNRIFLGGEETRPPFATRHGAAWAHIVSGPAANQSWELPHLGQCAFENVVASPFPQAKTIVMGLDDSDAQTNPMLTTQPSEVYVYVGTKQASGNDVTRAGLTGGTLYGVRAHVNGSVVAQESNAFGLGSGTYVGSGTFELVSLGDASTFDGAAQQAASIANDIFRMQRVEDGAWDPRPGFENDFYFVTTASGSTNSRLWRLRFTAIAEPELGGTIEILLDGSEGQINLDNMCVDPHGRVFMQEDTGGSSHLAAIWMYDLVTGRLIQVAAPDPQFFTAGGASFLTTNEEASGVIPAFDLLGDGWYLMSFQNHAASADPELVEGGQLIALFVDPDLGRELVLWFSSPAGPGSVAVHHRFGTPNATFLSPVTLAPGLFPNGWFFGLDIAFADLLAQATAGPPFLGTLDAEGRSTSVTFTGIPAGITLFGVAIDDIASLPPNVSEPVSYAVP